MLLKKIFMMIGIISVSNTIEQIEAGPISCAAGLAFYGTCQTACNAGYMACMASSGLVAGSTGPVGWWAWLTSAAAGCSAIQGTCMATCALTSSGMCGAPVP